MSSEKIDPVLLIVGLILILAVVLWVGTMLLFPADTFHNTQKCHQYSSAGKVFGEKNCWKEKKPDVPGYKRISGTGYQKRSINKGFSCRNPERQI